jgi:hypothetical protein
VLIAAIGANTTSGGQPRPAQAETFQSFVADLVDATDVALTTAGAEATGCGAEATGCGADGLTC